MLSFFGLKYSGVIWDISNIWVSLYESNFRLYQDSLG